jgi:hypothetical protein
MTELFEKDGYLNKCFLLKQPLVDIFLELTGNTISVSGLLPLLRIATTVVVARDMDGVGNHALPFLLSQSILV